MIVTGAASGIGRALTIALAERGATIFAADRDRPGLSRLVESIWHGDVRPVELDVTDRQAVFDAVDQAVEESGRLDLMFNNAGIVVGGNFDEMTDAVWQHIVDINFWGVVYGTQAAYARMVSQRSGHIVNTASTAGVIPVPRSTAYAATKHAIVGLSTSLRCEAAPHRVKVSVLIPGLVDTAIFDSAINLETYNYRTAADRLAMPKITPARAAIAILKGVARDDAVITFPTVNRIVIGLYRTAPGVMTPLMTRVGM